MYGFYFSHIEHRHFRKYFCSPIFLFCFCFTALKPKKTNSFAIRISGSSFDFDTLTFTYSFFLFLFSLPSRNPNLFFQILNLFLLNQHPNLPIPTAPSLHKAVRPSLAAVTHVLHATAASSMQSASAGRQTRYVRRKHKEHRHTETKTQKFNTK